MCMNKKTTKLSGLIALALLVPALVCAADSSITKQQRQVGEDFVKALKKDDLKAAFQLFSPSVSGIYRFEIFSEIQKNLNQTIGTPISSKLQKPKKTDAQDSAPSSTYDMVYALGDKKSAIPLELTFDPKDSKGRLASFKYLQDQMKPVGQ